MRKKIKNIDDIQMMLWSFASHRVITVAARLGILKSLSEGRYSNEKLALKLGFNSTAAAKMLRVLSALGFLESRGDEYWVYDELARFFIPGDEDLTPFLEHSHNMYDSFGKNLEEWVRTGQWETLPRNGERVVKFALAMQAMGTGVAKQMAEVVNLDGAEKLLDVGGSLGHYSKVLVAKNPKLKATVLDIKEVTELGIERVLGTPFENRIKFLAGDYMEDDWGKDYDFVLLANVIHQESKKDAAKMIKKAADALKNGGTAAVVDFSIDDRQREHVLGSLFAINMRCFGDTHTEPDIRSWMKNTGLENIERRDLSSFRWLILGRKPAQSK